jgi:hypothetical protein
LRSLSPSDFGLWALDIRLGTMLNRPPPYFPQNQLGGEPDENRYRKFKLTVAAVIVVVLLVLAGLGFGVYYLVRWMF